MLHSITKYLEKHDICAQIIMPGAPQQNDIIVERHNHTLWIC